MSFSKTGYNKTIGGIDPSIKAPGTDLTDCKGEPYCEWVRANVLAFRDHPAVSGFYACDDCAFRCVTVFLCLSRACLGKQSLCFKPENSTLNFRRCFFETWLNQAATSARARRRSSSTRISQLLRRRSSSWTRTTCCTAPRRAMICGCGRKRCEKTAFFEPGFKAWL